MIITLILKNIKGKIGGKQETHPFRIKTIKKRREQQINYLNTMKRFENEVSLR